MTIIQVASSGSQPLWAAQLLTREIFGNIPPWAKLLFYALAAASLSCFTWGCYRRLRKWQGPGRLGAWFNWQDLGTHGQAFGRRVLGQQRMRGARRKTANRGHACLFSGFAVLFVGTLLIAVEHILASLLGRGPKEPVFHRGLYFAAYELMLDTFGLVFLSGIAILANRRRKRPRSVDHSAADWVVLATLFAIGVTGFAVEGLRLLVEPPAWPFVSYVGASCAFLWRPFVGQAGTAATYHLWLWWLHALAALALIAAWPYSRLRHSIAGTLNLLQDQPLTVARPRLHLEQFEQQGYLGPAQLSDLSARQRLMLDACVACGRCQDVCPAHAAGKPLSPKAVVQNLWQLLESTETPGGPAEESSGSGNLATEVVGAPALWSCTTCAACVVACPLGVSPLEYILDLRQNLVGENQLRGSAAQALQKVQRAGNPWGLPAADRLQWAQDLHVPTVAECPDFELLYWVGCAAAYDRRAGRIARATVQLLHAAGVRFAVLAQQERCTGEAARRLGDEFLFQELAAANLEHLQHHQVRRIVTHCPHCLNSLRHDYAQFDAHFTVLHHSELLAELIADGRLPLRAPPTEVSAAAKELIFHDPCYLARMNQQTTAPRRILQEVTGHGQPWTLRELPRNRQQTACCGAGGGRMWFDDPLRERVGADRVQEIVDSGASAVAVGCPFCLIMISDGLAASQPQVEVRDVAEWLADQLPPSPQKAPQP